MLLDNDEINLYYNFEMKISKKKKNFLIPIKWN